MPHKELEELKRVVNQLAGVRGALQISERASREMVEWSLRENVVGRLLVPSGIAQAIDTGGENE